MICRYKIGHNLGHISNWLQSNVGNYDEHWRWKFNPRGGVIDAVEFYDEKHVTAFLLRWS